MSEADQPFAVFGTKSTFALEVRHARDSVIGEEPEEWKGSWGEWRLWISGLNLCRFRQETAEGSVEVEEVRWFLAPLFKWIADNWMPLIHEHRLPPGGRVGDSRPRWARQAYLSMLESAGDDLERFAPWQCWASRHSLRAASAGGILPDVFVQRTEDDLEFSWGDRVQPGVGAATSLMEDGVARASVDAVAGALSSVVEWFLERQQANPASWVSELQTRWKETGQGAAGISALSWYLDSSPEPRALTEKFLTALERLKRSLSLGQGPWLGSLSPEVAMFGDLSPNISSDAAERLLAEHVYACTDVGDSDKLTELVSSVPAWSTSSPWHNGYALARDILDEMDPDPGASMTRIERMLEDLGIRVREVHLGEQGPRGVALAGGELQATVLINLDDLRNTARGRRITMAHELCHILFDRSHARALAHSSTPWASPAVEQRANAFAAMLLMPPTRAKLWGCRDDMAELKREVGQLADRLNVSRNALKRHLANIEEIGVDERDFLLGDSIS